jgi:hypothetical protein
MNKPMRLVARSGAYALSLAAGAVGGALLLYLVVGALYVGTRGDQVTDSYECAHGMVLGLGAMLGGAVCGAGLAGYGVSHVFYGTGAARSADPRESAARDAFERAARTATHLVCSGGVAVGFSAFSIPRVFLPVALLGLGFSLVGTVRFVGAHLRMAKASVALSVTE